MGRSHSRWSGDMNLRLNGYEIVGADQVSILGIGQELVDTSGDISGDLTLSYTDSTDPTDSGTCPGTLGDSNVTFQGGDFGTLGSGQFNITLEFTPKSPVGSTACVDTTFTLLCNRTLVHKNLAKDLNAGEYHCVATGVTSGAAFPTATAVPASVEGHLDIVSGSNGSNS